MRNQKRRRKVFLTAIRTAENATKYAKRVAGDKEDISTEAIATLAHGLCRAAASLIAEVTREDWEVEDNDIGLGERI